MKIYSFKNELYSSLKDCINDNNIIKIPTAQNLPEDLLKKLNINIIDLKNRELEQFIIKQSQKVKAYRNKLLAETDKYVLPDYPITQLDLLSMMTYRQYLRNYTRQEEWWKEKPLTFETWNSSLKNNNFYE